MAADAGVYERLVALVAHSRQGETLGWRIQSDIVFHRALLESSGVGPLLVFDDLLQIFFSRFFPDAEDRPCDDPWLRIVEEHQTLLDQLRAGDVDGARRVLSAHLGHYDSANGG
jgi:DNA-binding FadR family transcriptional regulator